MIEISETRVAHTNGNDDQCCQRADNIWLRTDAVFGDRERNVNIKRAILRLCEKEKPAHAQNGKAILEG